MTDPIARAIWLQENSTSRLKIEHHGEQADLFGGPPEKMYKVSGKAGSILVTERQLRGLNLLGYAERQGQTNLFDC